MSSSFFELLHLRYDGCLLPTRIYVGGYLLDALAADIIYNRFPKRGIHFGRHQIGRVKSRGLRFQNRAHERLVEF